jgi:hypothetical protein
VIISSHLAESAAAKAGKKVAERLPDAALTQARTSQELTDPILLAEILGMRKGLLQEDFYGSRSFRQVIAEPLLFQSRKLASVPGPAKEVVDFLMNHETGIQCSPQFRCILDYSNHRRASGATG